MGTGICAAARHRRARGALQHEVGKTRTVLADWARSLLAKKPFKVVAVALANRWPGSGMMAKIRLRARDHELPARPDDKLRLFALKTTH